MAPLDLLPLRVQIKSDWADPWVTFENVEPLTASLSAASVAAFQFRVKYGVVKHPLQSAITLQDHTQADRQWVRCLRFPYADEDILFQGTIESDTRDLFGAVGGEQVFTAYDGVRILQKIEIRSTIVDQEGSKVVHDTLLPFNLHPTGREESPNRSTATIDGNFVFARDGDPWTIDDAIEYLIEEFVNETDSPVWTILGSIPNEIEPLEIGEMVTAFGLLELLINQAAGFSFVVLPTVDGYTLKVFSLAVEEVVFGGVTIPANPETIVVTNATNPEIALRIEESAVNTFKKITVFGAPMVIARSFTLTDASLLKDWESTGFAALIIDYEASDDEGRQDEIYKNLWTRFVASHDETKWTGDNNPTLEAAGTLDFTTAAPVPQFTGSLESLPTKTGNDYVDGTPVNEYNGDFMTPLVFVKDPLDDPDDKFHEFKSLEFDMDLVALPGDIGVHIRTKHPHLLALEDFDPFEIDSETPARFLLDNVVVTIAFNSTQRLRREHIEGGATKADGEKIINVPDAEFWWIAEGTAIGVYGDDAPMGETEGELKIILPTEGVIIRDDGAKLDRVMAGSIARYITPRGKASGTAEGLFLYHLDIGKVLITDDPDVESILTSVTWNFENGFTTSLDSGFAI